MNKTSGKLQACFGGLLWVFPIVIYKSSPDVLPSSRSQLAASHLLDNGAVAVRTAFATGPPTCHTVTPLCPLTWKPGYSWAPFTPKSVSFHAFCSLKALFFKDAPPPPLRAHTQFPFLPAHTRPFEKQPTAVPSSGVVLPSVTTPSTPMGTSWHGRRHFATWRNSKIIHEVSQAELWSLVVVFFLFFFNEWWFIIEDLGAPGKNENLAFCVNTDGPSLMYVHTSGPTRWSCRPGAAKARGRVTNSPACTDA